ncbi:TetR/AcrR family transcriptional regulator [Actinomadura madurae]|uniref:TetR/AcrR family transcriptional regulator n=2 Tax=Actinomadura madurae TaxID=1993 RepID=UPI0020D1FD86|nr:TetR family transcriptional regulator [Actinomadura madurae]MCP9950889.1 TetR family transcriptional regulator [Actinomadura madurae]MCP9967676.1 TetR family transcriptional regulator [Actinomadura madurae]MCP9980124.1 TetR family transcriptional regulator [Actinomadura madurae]MCQ0008347.1 TetR family transcriptional regulator [Actinomadura madurae]MCQ0016336.1 TetR family transcriptional regulator [Actinomadura madurae]
MMSRMTTGTSRRGRPPKGESRLSREAIVQATLQVIEADGVNAVSMRAVGRVLGVDAKSLYNHVDGKDGLLDAVAEHLLGAVVLPEPTGDPRADLRAIADAFRERALTHPEAASLVLTRQLGSFEGLAPVEAVLVVLRDAGCRPDESVHLLRMLVATVIGSLLREVSAGPAYGTTDIAGIARRRSVLEGRGLPAIAEAAPHLARFDGAAEYEFAIGLVLDALIARLGDRR